MSNRVPAAALPEVLRVTPITAARSAPRRGRKPKLEVPPFPDFPMAEDEKKLYEFFIESHRLEYAPLSYTDEIHLQLAAVAYINSLRVAQEELRSGQVISMARQHPLVQMRAELDLLSFTRKARTQGKTQESPEMKQAREHLMKLSS